MVVLVRDLEDDIRVGVANMENLVALKRRQLEIAVVLSGDGLE